MAELSPRAGARPMAPPTQEEQTTVALAVQWKAAPARSPSAELAESWLLEQRVSPREDTPA
jgi:hypothetical protein